MQRKFPKRRNVRGIGDGFPGFLRGAMFGEDEIACADDHLLLALADEHGLTGVLGRQRVAAALEAHETIEAGLARNELTERITRRTVENAELFLFPEIEWTLPGGGVDAAVGRVHEPVAALRVEIAKIAERAAVEESIFHVVDHALDFALVRGRRTR